MATIQGASTAIQRTRAPEPLRWLNNHNLIKGRALDYGSGRQCWYDMVCYDPYWRPVKLSGLFDTITCNYVLNVVPQATQRSVLNKIHRLLRPGGTAYITVRRDIPRAGKQGRGTFQRYIKLGLPSIRRTSGYEIYKMEKA